MSRRCVSTCLRYACIAIGALFALLMVNDGYNVVRLHIRRGLQGCSFRHIGQFSGASGCEASNSLGLHAFFMSFYL